MEEEERESAVKPGIPGKGERRAEKLLQTEDKRVI